MTESPDVPPPPPTAPPEVPVTSLPAGSAAGRPRIWQALVLFLAFGLLAGGSCAVFLGGLGGGSHAPSDLWSFLFVASVPLAAGAFALLVFRLWRRRLAEAWPSVGQALLMGLAGAGLAVGGCGGWAATMEVSEIWPVAMALGAVFVLGAALATGAGELFLIAIARLILPPKK